MKEKEGPMVAVPQTLLDFEEALREHDWYFAQSDGESVWDRGALEWDKLKEFAAAAVATDREAATDLWDKYAPYGFDRVPISALGEVTPAPVAKLSPKGARQTARKIAELLLWEELVADQPLAPRDVAEKLELAIVSVLRGETDASRQRKARHAYIDWVEGGTG
jgi:hypothetical protein